MIKRWNGSSWVQPPIKRWNGSSWVNVNAYRWNGSSWVNITTQKYTTTWSATWSQSYLGSNSKRTDSKGNSRMYQGLSGIGSYGIQRSLCGFNHSDMRSKLDGAKILSVELYLRNQHWYYVSGGGRVVLGYHNHSSEPSTFSHSKYDAKRQKYSKRNEAKWIPMPVAFGNGLRDNRYKGFSIYAHVLQNDRSYYGYFYGASSSSRPKIKITYEK